MPQSSPTSAGGPAIGTFLLGGTGAMILAAIEVGDTARIGANAVVLKIYRPLHRGWRTVGPLLN